MNLRNFIIAALLVWAALFCCLRLAFGEDLPDAPHLKTRTHGFIIVAPGDPFVGEANIVHNNIVIGARRNLDWQFLTAHGVYLGAIAFDLTATNHGLHSPCGYTEGGGYGARSIGGIARNDLIEFAAVTTMDYLLKRTQVRGLSYIGAAIGTAKHAHGGAEWVEHCY